jgi:Spy/CpxP family protein refolding chaperone
MVMKSVIKIVVLSSLMIVFLAAGAYAGPGGRCCMQGGGALSSLNADQLKKAKEIQIETLRKIQPLSAEKSKKRLEIMELASKEKYDDAAVQKKQDELWAIQDKIRAESREMGQKIRSLLTDEQKKTLCPLDTGVGCGMRGGSGFGMGPGAGFGMMGGPGGGCGMMRGCAGAGCPLAIGGAKQP